MNIQNSQQLPSVGATAPADMTSNNEDDTIDFLSIGRMLLRRRWVIINTVFFLSALALIILVQLTPRYTGTTTLAVETRQSNVVNLEAVMSGMGTDVAAIKTEIDVLKSYQLVGKMVDELKLINDPEFNAGLGSKRRLLSVINPFNYLPTGWEDAVFGVAKVLSPEDQARRERSKVITAVMDRYEVKNPSLSYTIALSFESEDPKKAARMANSLADQYLNGQNGI